jgi:hypothetical protein
MGGRLFPSFASRGGLNIKLLSNPLQNPFTTASSSTPLPSELICKIGKAIATIYEPGVPYNSASNVGSSSGDAFRSVAYHWPFQVRFQMQKLMQY